AWRAANAAARMAAAAPKPEAWLTAVKSGNPTRAMQRAAGAAVRRSDAEQRKAQAVFLRDIFGNPFRPTPTLEPSLLHWNGGAVVQLARAAYEERMMPEGHLDPARLAVLADAVEEAGAPEEVLAHLRAPGSHMRGCWCLDIILGKS